MMSQHQGVNSAAPHERRRQRKAERQVELRDIFSLRAPRDLMMQAVRAQQIDTILRLAPLTITIQLICGAVLLAALSSSVDGRELLSWFVVAGAVCAVRVGRAWRLRRDADYERRVPATFISATLTVGLLSIFWLVPPILWFDNATPSAQLLMAVVSAVLVSAGSLTFISVPPAALAYVTVTLASTLVIAVKLDNMPMAALTLIYGLAVMIAIIASARQFIAKTRASIALEEQSEIITILREFEASGSGGLWELDEKMRMVKMSEELADQIGANAASLIGIPVRKLLDPQNRVAELSSGMQDLFRHLHDGTPFRDIAIPAIGNDRWWAISGRPTRDNNGKVIGWRGVASDITDVRLTGIDSVREARRDPLTGIANRLLLRELLEEMILENLDDAGSGALLMADLDRFKLVNDTMGHAIGDRLLCDVARRFEQVVGDEGHVGRLGGDEFAVVWHGSNDEATLRCLASRLIEEVSRSFKVGGATLNIGATVGIAVGGRDGKREGNLMRAADLALYHAKRSGRGKYAFFAPALLTAAEDSRLLENDVRDALTKRTMHIAYQRIVDSKTHETVCRESLLRWDHPTRGSIPPHKFIPIIEDVGLIHQIGAWVIQRACKEAMRWPDRARVAVNISAAQLGGEGLEDVVREALETSGLEPDRLELEVTETIFIGEDGDMLDSLERLRTLGVRLVLDDFGKGYSSLGYLSRAHFAKIKIDKDFVHGAARGERDRLAIVQAILALAEGLGIETTAEGVETEGEIDMLTAMGVSQLQGYYFGRPESTRPDSVPERRQVRQKVG